MEELIITLDLFLEFKFVLSFCSFFVNNRKEAVMSKRDSERYIVYWKMYLLANDTTDKIVRLLVASSFANKISLIRKPCSFQGLWGSCPFWGKQLRGINFKGNGEKLLFAKNIKVWLILIFPVTTNLIRFFHFSLRI